MLENIKFEGILYKNSLNDKKEYWLQNEIERLEYVDCFDEDCYIMVHLKDGHSRQLYFNDDWYIDGIQLDCYSDSWYVIDTQITNHVLYLLLENEVYGDECSHIIIDHLGNVILDEVWNGFDDLNDLLETD